MTDKEIIEKLENVRYHLPAGEHKAVIDDALDLIKNQHTSINQLYRVIDDKIRYNKHVKAEKNKLMEANILQSKQVDELQAEIDKLQEFADALHLSTIRLYDIEVVPFDSVKNWAKTFGIKIIGGSDAL